MLASLAFFFLFVALCSSLFFVKDYFSPDKFILASLGLFFGDIFISKYDEVIYVIYIFMIIIYIIGILMYKTVINKAKINTLGHQSYINLKPNYTFFWLVSIPGILANIYMIISFGGIIGYINSIAMREIEFKGMGVLTMFLKTFPVVNLLYFCYFINDKDKNFRKKVFYMLHFIIFVCLALITTSRGALLNNMVMMMIIYHYTLKNVSKKFILYTMIGVFTLASVLEVAREGISYTDGKLMTGLSYEDNDQKASVTWAKYGLIPLDLVLNSNNVKPHYGGTYLTAVTNFIPRTIWPDKPDTGGVVLTKEYTGDAWGGSSYLATGLLPEAMINFGVSFGLLFGYIQFFFLVFFILIIYKNYTRKLFYRKPYFVFSSVKYVYILWGAMALIVGEFTKVSTDLAIKLGTVLLIQAAAVMFGLHTNKKLALK